MTEAWCSPALPLAGQERGLWVIWPREQKGSVGLGASNPALAALQFLAGSWDMELSEASFLPDPEAKVGGSVTVEWIEQGAALVMRMGDAAAPMATWIIGRDDCDPDYHVLYADDRGVSRVYRMSLGDRAERKPLCVNRRWHPACRILVR
jgi:hypothetical protein